MPITRAKCFISYSHADVDGDALDYLRFLLDEASGDKYEILLDKDLSYGSDLQEFMALLDSVDAVLLVLTPTYKKKVNAKKGGSYDEYRRIYTRYEQLQAQKKQGKKIGEIDGYFELIPILLSGDEEDSIPDEILHLKYLSLTGLRVSKNEHSEFIVTDHIRRNFAPEVSKIAERLQFITTIKSPSFEELYEQYYERLFVDLKADWQNPKHVHHTYVDTLFVKTFAYRKIEQQSVYFIIGRKGSGKSTVTGVLEQRQRNKFKGHIGIIADDFDLEGPYALFNLDQVLSDTKTVVSRLQCFQFAWEAFFYICCIEILVSLSEQPDHLTNYQLGFIPPLKKFLDKLRESNIEMRDSERKRTYFAYTFNAVINFVKDCIDGARSDPKFFYSDIHARFTRLRFLRYALDEGVLQSFDEIISTCRRKFLITLDGFDTTFDMFRRRSIVEHANTDLERRTLFEIDWLRSLLLLILNIKQQSADAQSNRFYGLIQVCITVPKDRFYEVLRTERDSYRYHNRFCSLEWSGIELSILLRKRLEELAQVSSDKKKSPVDRLSGVLKAKFPHLLGELSFDYNGKTYTMPLFLYVLRHTFWRPRDVLLYYAKIIATSEDLRRKRIKVSAEAIRRAIKEATYEVIQSEFINEFSSTVINIRDILSAFSNSKQFLTYNEISEILTRVDFRFAIGPEISLNRVDEKIEYLYQIGFLGIEVTPAMRDRFNIEHKHSFYFNEGLALLKTEGENRFHDYTFIIHPIFSEYLQLNTSDHELVLEFSWDYLREMDVLLSVSGNP